MCVQTGPSRVKWQTVRAEACVTEGAVVGVPGTSMLELFETLHLRIRRMANALMSSMASTWNERENELKVPSER